eukprot:886178-Rhodomonas_salina.4
MIARLSSSSSLPVHYPGTRYPAGPGENGHRHGGTVLKYQPDSEELRCSARASVINSPPAGPGHRASDAGAA